MDSQEINSLLNEARSSVSNYCINTCKSQCCKRGSLILLNEKEVKSIVGNQRVQMKKEKILCETSNKFHTYNLEKKACKNLSSENTCLIHTRKNRPKVCGDYPLFFLKNTLITAQDCPAVRIGFFDPYLERIKKEGIKII